jgi:hypothetical protein
MELGGSDLIAFIAHTRPFPTNRTGRVQSTQPQIGCGITSQQHSSKEFAFHEQQWHSQIPKKIART